MTRSKWFQASLLAASVAGIAACGGENNPIAAPKSVTPVTNPGNGSGNGSGAAPNLGAYKYLIVAGDQSGTINFYGDDGVNAVAAISDPAATGKNFTLSLKDSSGKAYGLGEIHIVASSSDQPYALVLLTSGVKDAMNMSVGGGVAVIDLQRLALAGVIPLASQSGKPTMPGHAYLSSDHKTLWINNDGPQDDPATTTTQENIGADSVFVLQVSDLSVNVDAAGKLSLAPYTLVEVPLGDGTKFAAFAHSMTPNPAVHAWYAATNATDQTVSIVDHSDMAKLMKMGPFDLNAQLPVGSPKRNRPAGVAFSPVSGKFYIGIESAQDVALVTIDAKTATGTMPALNFDMYKVGNAASMKIPAAGYVAAGPAGDYVFTVGYVPGPMGAPESGHGYLSIIDARMDMVTDVVDLGNLYANNILVHADMATMAMKVFVPGADMTMADPANPEMPMSIAGLRNNQIAVVAVMPDTGKAMPQTNGQRVQYVDVPMGAMARAGQFTLADEHAIFPAGNAADCMLDHHPHAMADMTMNGCMHMSVVNVADNKVVATLQTAGHMPNAVGVWKIVAGSSNTGSPPATGGTMGGMPMDGMPMDNMPMSVRSVAEASRGL